MGAKRQAERPPEPPDPPDDGTEGTFGTQFRQRKRRRIEKTRMTIHSAPQPRLPEHDPDENDEVQVLETSVIPLLPEFEAGVEQQNSSRARTRRRYPSRDIRYMDARIKATHEQDNTSARNFGNGSPAKPDLKSKS